MNLSNVVRRSSTAVWVLIALLTPAFALAGPSLFPNWSVSQMTLDLKEGGRANSVAVHPKNPDEMFAASDTGGLFKSMDGGLHWTHVDGLPVIFTQSVAYVPDSPDVVIVSARNDFKTNGSAVWRSVDGGDHWSPATIIVTPPPSPVTGFEISALGNAVVVGISSGILVSDDAGATWRWWVPFGPADPVVSVLLTAGDGNQLLPRIYAAGPAGVRTGILFGNQTGDWRNPGNFIGGNPIGMHAFGRSALSPMHAYITDGHQFFRTEDRGATWTEIPLLLHGPDPCFGTAFIKTIVRRSGAGQFLDLYHGSGCGVDRLIAPVVNGVPDYSGNWTPLTTEQHTYTRDLAVNANEPLLLASNGGLQKTANGGATWTYAGAGGGGYNALQVGGVTGQYVGKHFLDLYFATQDNGVRAVNAAGNETGSDATSADGYYIEAERHVRWFFEPSNITYSTCATGCSVSVADRFLMNPSQVAGAHGVRSVPIVIGHQRRVKLSETGLDVNTDLSLTSWEPFAFFDDQVYEPPKLGFAGADGSTIVYQAMTPVAWGSLMRIENSGGTTNVVTPPMSGFGTLANNRSVIAAPRSVLDADRGNGVHLIAADEKAVKSTTTGGDDWEEIAGLKDLVTNGGALRFNARLWGIPATMPLVTAISFSPDDPNQVLLGTSEGGIYHSYNGGATWGPIGRSEGATYVTSFFWANLNDVYVSTFGRGIWKLHNDPIAPPDAFGDLCPKCDVVNDNGVRPPFDHTVVVFDGEVLGVRTEKGQLREVFVTPGSSAIFTAEAKEGVGIVVTESEGKEAMEPLPKAPADGLVAVAVVYTRDGEWTGAAFNEGQLSLTATPDGK